MDQALLDALLRFIDHTGVAAGIIFSSLFLGWKILPNMLDRWNRGTTALERIAECMGGMVAKQDGFTDDLHDFREEVRHDHAEFRDATRLNHDAVMTALKQRS